jgi:hypothetical protein
MKLKKAKIKLVFNAGEEEVQAFIIGDLALHPSRMDKKKWTMTHVPTSMSFKSVVPAAIIEDKDRALLWMKKVQEEFKKDWMAMRKFKRDDIIKSPEHTRGIRERIRNHCMTTTI